MSIVEQMDRNFFLAQEMAGIMQNEGEHSPYRTAYVRLVGELEAILDEVYNYIPDARPIIEKKLEKIAQCMTNEIIAMRRKDPLE